jgi:hypothetical protein
VKPPPSTRGRKAKSAEPWIPADRAERLNSHIAHSPSTSAVIIDGNNVRGCVSLRTRDARAPHPGDRGDTRAPPCLAPTRRAHAPPPHPGARRPCDDPPRISTLAFRWSNVRLEALVCTWARQLGIVDRIVVVWDHGACAEAFEYGGVVQAFAGPRATADDVIAAQVGRVVGAGVRRVWVATSDRELMARASFAGGSAGGGADGGGVRIVSSGQFCALLALATPQTMQPTPDGDGTTAMAAEPATSAAAWAESARVDAGVRSALCARLERSESQLRTASHAAQPRKPKRRRARGRAQGPGSAPGVGDRFNERTWHRVVLAERLRRLLAQAQPEAARAAAPQAADAAPQPDRWAAWFVGQYNLAARTAVAQPDTWPPDLTRDRRLDGEGRAALLAFARELGNSAAADDDEAAAGAPADDARGDASEQDERTECDPDDASAPSAAADGPPYKLTRRARRTLRSTRARHARAQGELLAGLQPLNEREAALGQLDAWLSCVDEVAEGEV